MLEILNCGKKAKRAGSETTSGIQDKKMISEGGMILMVSRKCCSFGVPFQGCEDALSVRPTTRMSSIYIWQAVPKRPARIFSMTDWKYVGALCSPRGSRVNCMCPCLRVEKAV